MCVISFVSHHAFVNIKGGGVLSSLSVAYLTLSYPSLRCLSVILLLSLLHHQSPILIPCASFLFFRFRTKRAYFFSFLLLHRSLADCWRFARILQINSCRRCLRSLRLRLHTLICQKLPDLSLFASLSLFFVCALCSAVLFPSEEPAR